MDCAGVVTKQAHECVIREIENLIKDLETRDPCTGLFTPPKTQPNFLGPKGSRYIRDLEHVPLITNIPIVEIRPTSTKKVFKEKVPNVLRILFKGPQSTHMYNTWNRPTPAKSIEIKSGERLDYCLCEKYNGLQDRCERTGCGTCLCLLPRPGCIQGKLKKLQPPNPDKQGLAQQAYQNSLRERRPFCCHPTPPHKWKGDEDKCVKM